MKISWIKYGKDNNSFRMQERLGMNVYRINDLDDIDKKMNEIIKSNCRTIIVSNDVASFSEDIIKKYQNDSNINIIITPRRKA